MKIVTANWMRLWVFPQMKSFVIVTLLFQWQHQGNLKMKTPDFQDFNIRLILSKKLWWEEIGKAEKNSIFLDILINSCVILNMDCWFLPCVCCNVFEKAIHGHLVGSRDGIFQAWNAFFIVVMSNSYRFLAIYL